MDKEKQGKKIKPEQVTMDLLISFFKRKSNIARFYKVTPETVTCWGKWGADYVPPRRRYEFVSRINEIDDFLKK